MLSSASRPVLSAVSLRFTTPPSGIAWRSVDQQVDQHLLDLGGVHPRERPAHELDFEPDLVPRQVFVDQQNHFFYKPVEINGDALIGVAPGRDNPSIPPVIAPARWPASRIRVSARSR